MPIYTYHCENCAHQFDKHQSFSEEPLVVCPACRKHQLRKVYSAAGVVFKGSGFYVTDKKSASSSLPAKKAKSNGDGGEAGGKAEKKSETPKSKPVESKASESKSTEK